MKIMKKCDCDLCVFNNPRPSTAGVIIKDGKLLVAKRVKEPFEGEWDFLGGYVGEGETAEEAHKREIKEELGVDCDITLIGSFPGTAQYKDLVNPVLNFAYLTELKGEIKLNTAENSDVAWIPLKELRTIAFDSNQKILKLLQEKFSYDLDNIKQLVAQLDPSAEVNEQSLYKAILGGYVSKVEKEGETMGMGWIFPRQTMLRRQAVVEDMIVNKKYRGQGLGEKILLDLIDWARKQGIETVELTTNPKRVAANSLYQKVGFVLHPTNHYLLKL